VSEAPGTSQIVEAIQAIAAPPGSIIAWCGQESDPAVAGVRALALNGQGIVRANYADLDTAIYCGNSNNATADSCYRATDAAGTYRSTSGAYLILPDMRGRFLRGLDLAGTRDFEGVSRIVGSYQSSLVRDHYHQVKTDHPTMSSTPYLHPMNVWLPTSGISGYSVRPYTTFTSIYNYKASVIGISETTNDDDNTPYNMAIHFWIRY
jgi:hypothetical protein